MRNITGTDSSGAETAKPPEAVEQKGREKGKDTIFIPATEEGVAKLRAMAAAETDLAKANELRHALADYEASVGLALGLSDSEMIEQEASKGLAGASRIKATEEFKKEAQKSADALRLNLQREKASEEQRIQEQKAASIKDLQSKATRIGIDKDLELWGQKQAEEKARRERLDLE